METNEQAVIPMPQPAQNGGSGLTIFDNAERFEHAQRVAKALSSSDLVPAQFKGNVANTLIALDIADRIKANPLAVMQSLYIVHGKPGWASTFLIAMVNTCGRFEPMQFEMTGGVDADDRTCVAWALPRGVRLPASKQWTIATVREAGYTVLESPPVSIGMAKKEGWYSKNGSKWQTMPELMLRYRAATFFSRLYAPDLTMGMQTAEEVRDVIEVTATTDGPKRVKTDAPAGIVDGATTPKQSELMNEQPRLSHQQLHANLMEAVSAAGLTEEKVLTYLKEIKLAKSGVVELFQLGESTLKTILEKLPTMTPEIKKLG